MVRAKSFVTCAVVGVLLLGVSSLSGSDEKSGPEINTLLRTALDKELGADREAFVQHVTMPPNSTLDWHRHPGEAFHYYLEGKVTIEIEGQESIEGLPGTVGHVPYRVKHRAITGEAGATVLVFRVHVADEPVRYVDSL